MAPNLYNPFPRLLEEVARMPYFSYVSMLHLYETLGWWRAGADLRKVQGDLLRLPFSLLPKQSSTLIRLRLHTY